MHADFALSFIDRLSNWIQASDIPEDRYLWVLDNKTREITWKNRQCYSCWNSGETGRLQEIFREMIEQTPLTIELEDNEQFQNLLELKERITTSYNKFLNAHESFLVLSINFCLPLI